MKTIYDKKNRQWCAYETFKGADIMAWGDTKEEAIKEFEYMKKKELTQL